MNKLERVLAAAPKAAAAGPDFNGHWKNELGSTMYLAVKGNKVEGTYTTRVSGSDKELTADLIGYINGDLISFVVSWPVASITAWVGQLTDYAGIEQIQTFWQLTQNVPDADEPKKMWSSVNVGADEFVRA